VLASILFKPINNYLYARHLFFSMPKKFVLVSLQEKKARRIAEVISNKTCRKMLDYMASVKDTTEGELSRKLRIPISTVHYNMKALMAAKLVKSDEYHYSEKGKEVSHYRLANQYVIIAPAEEKQALREKLKSLLPVALVAGFSAALIRLFSGYYLLSSSVVAVKKGAASSVPLAPVDYVVDETAEVVAGTQQAADSVVMNSGQEAVRAVAQRSVESASSAPVSEPVTALVSHPSFLDYVSSHVLGIVFWFVVGFVLGAGIFFLVRYYLRKRSVKKIK